MFRWLARDGELGAPFCRGAVIDLLAALVTF